METVIIIITILALLSIAVPELSDLSHLVSVATEYGEGHIPRQGMQVYAVFRIRMSVSFQERE